jgi:DNA repair/transcription protein MET18/MMS19
MVRTGALNRRDALECLSKIATIPYELIHPYKDTVLKQLSLCLDDRKRFVRHVAVRVRNQWSVL